MTACKHDQQVNCTAAAVLVLARNTQAAWGPTAATAGTVVYNGTSRGRPHRAQNLNTKVMPRTEQ